MDRQRMSQKIRMYRQQRGITQAQLAKMVGVSTSYIGHIERGSRNAGLRTFINICSALRISVDSVALPPESEQSLATYTQEQYHKAHTLLEIALDLCKAKES